MTWRILWTLGSVHSICLPNTDAHFESLSWAGYGHRNLQFQWFVQIRPNTVVHVMVHDTRSHGLANVKKCYFVEIETMDNIIVGSIRQKGMMGHLRALLLKWEGTGIEHGPLTTVLSPPWKSLAGALLTTEIKFFILNTQQPSPTNKTQPIQHPCSLKEFHTASKSMTHFSRNYLTLECMPCLKNNK